MKKIYTILFGLIILFSTFSYAQAALDYKGLVKCDGVVTPGESGRTNPCDFKDLIETINSIIRWVFLLTIPIFIGIIAYAGFLYMSPNPSNRSQANNMLWEAVKGFAIMLIAWTFVTTLLGWLVDPSFKGVINSLI